VTADELVLARAGDLAIGDCQVCVERPTDLTPPWFHVTHAAGGELGGVFTPQP
jgi:hypothetical protein